MSIADLIPGSPRLLVIGVLLVALVASTAGATLWVISPRLDLQTERAAQAEQALDRERELTALQARVLEQQQQQFARLDQVEQRMQQLGQTIDHNATANRRAFEDLKRNDQAIADYLAGPVPPALGLLYARPATTDPGAYVAPAAVQPGAVPAAGQARAADQ